ncbi:MAG: H-X9-DG-CTERM domain-containing protein [Armatimonadota bacterium]
MCPSEPDASEPTYAMNELFGKVNLEKVQNASEVLMFFESEPGRNAHGGKAYLLQCPTRHDGGMNTAFADGHVKWYKGDALSGLNLVPK